MSEDLFEWLFGVLTNPVETFRDISNKEPISVAIILVIFIALLNSVVLPQYRSIFEFWGLTMLSAFEFIAATFISVTMSFLWALLIYLVSLLFRGNASYWAVFSVLAFAQFPSILELPLNAAREFAGSIGYVVAAIGSFGVGLWVVILGVLAIRESAHITTVHSILCHLLAGLMLVVAAVFTGIIFAFALV